MKRVLFAIPTMRMGGAEQSLVSFLNKIDLDKYDVDLLLFEKNGELIDCIPSKINIIAADTVTRAMILEFRYFFKDLLRERHYLMAIVRFIMLINSKLEELTGRKWFFNWNIAKHFVKKVSKEYDVAIGYLEGTTDAYIIDKVNAQKKIGWIHTDFSKCNRHFFAEGRYYEKFDRIAVISTECERHFIDVYPFLADKTYVIENITDKAAVVAKSCEPIEEGFIWDTFTIVTVGRLEHVKGIDIAVEAASILHEKKVNFIWHVFGEGCMRKELEQKIQKFGLQDIFILNGTTTNPYKYMKRANIIVQPSRNEGRSMVLDEAKLLCRPIIVTNYPSAKDQIVDGVTGIIVDINPIALAAGIEKILNELELSEKLIHNCSLAADKTEAIMTKIVSIIEGE